MRMFRRKKMRKGNYQAFRALRAHLYFNCEHVLQSIVLFKLEGLFTIYIIFKLEIKVFFITLFSCYQLFQSHELKHVTSYSYFIQLTTACIIILIIANPLTCKTQTKLLYKKCFIKNMKKRTFIFLIKKVTIYLESKKQNLVNILMLCI